VVFLLFTGCRLGEALGVCWKDVSLSSGTVSIYRPKVRNAAVLPLHPDFAAELKRHRAARAVAEERVSADSDPVFPGRLQGGDRLQYYPRTAWA
jgi:integrase